MHIVLGWGSLSWVSCSVRLRIKCYAYIGKQDGLDTVLIVTIIYVCIISCTRSKAHSLLQQVMYSFVYSWVLQRLVLFWNSQVIELYDEL